MATNDDINELLNRYLTIENEIKTLQDDRKNLLAEFKDRIDPKSFQSALRAAKIKARVKPNEVTEYERILDILENRLCIEHVV